LYTYLAGIKEFHYFRIFNRFGKLMFETNNSDVGWNGNFNGTPQTMGIYIWAAEAIDKNGNTIQKRGETLLLR
jgi:gliding motility-associated-like protein